MRKAFGRGFDSRRLHHALLLLVLFSSLLYAQNDSIQVFDGARKLTISLHTIEGKPYLKITDLQSLLGLQITTIGANLSVTFGSGTVILSPNRALVSLNEKLVSLSSAVYTEDGVWYVPLDFISKVLKPSSTKPFLWLESTRSLILGDVQPNQLALKYAKDVNTSRVVFQSVRPIGFNVVPEGTTITILPKTEDFTLGFQDTSFTDGLIKQLTIQTTGEKRAFHLETDQNFDSYKSFELNNPPRLVVDFYRKVGPAQEPPPEEVPLVPPTMLPSTAPEKKVIVIDPGHGGDETGAVGPDGTFEKDITLAIARKLRALIEKSTGMRVILTRDSDKVVALDDRTALANNNKADLFVSIHCNSTVHGLAKGAETYFLSMKATDNEARNAAAVENNAIGLDQSLPNVDNDLKLILWDMAQTEYLAESSRLADTIQQQLNGALGITNRGIKQAPFRVLMGATMPAVLVEVGFINNPGEEKLMKEGEYQLKIAQSIFESVEKFQADKSARASQQSPSIQ